MCSKVTIREPFSEVLPCQKKTGPDLFFFDIATTPFTVMVTLPVRAPETVPTTEKETGTAPGHTPAAAVIVIVAVAKPTAKSSRTAAVQIGRRLRHTQTQQPGVACPALVLPSPPFFPLFDLVMGAGHGHWTVFWNTLPSFLTASAKILDVFQKKVQSNT